ncbi:lactonase family protein [Granulicella cerasi]|uniref:lactonase family protein n=1 Tax=Granulicella cerasi TaxID=741063 RepID=UPI0021DF9E87|nr:lactonase family protein [Granulicella cerasi]
MSRVAALSVLAVVPAFVGCGAFFQCEGKASCTTSTSTTSNVIFAGNSYSGSTYLDAYGNTTGTLAKVSGAPFSLSYTPTAMVVRSGNGYLYVAGTNGNIYSYVLSSAGVPSSGTAQYTQNYSQVDLAISPDGNWLFSVDSSTSTSPELYVYSFGTSGALSLTAAIPLTDSTGYTIVPKQIRVSPDNTYVAVAMGSGGVEVFPFTTSSGTLGNPNYVNTQSSADGDNAITWDGSHNLYIARSTNATTYSVLVYAAASNTVTTSVPSTYLTGTSPSALAFSSGYGYLYAANKGDSTISIFSQSSGALTSVGTVNAPSSVSSLTLDKSTSYLVASGYNSSAGLEVFLIGSSGGLTLQSTTESTGTSTSIAPALAATH